MNAPIDVPARPSAWTSYALLVTLVTVCAIGTAFAMWSIPDERPLLIVLGAPTILYFRIARYVGLGSLLLFCTFLSYFAVLLLPAFLFERRSKWRFLILLGGMGLVHLALGLAITAAVHGLHL